MRKLSNTEAELRKSVAYKKKRAIVFILQMRFDAPCHRMIVQACLKRIKYIGVKIKKETYFRLVEHANDLGYHRLSRYLLHANATPGICHLYYQKNRNITSPFFRRYSTESA